MRTDKSKELLHVSKIRAGLKDLERSLFATSSANDEHFGFRVLDVACQVFEGLSRSPIPMDYTIPMVKEVCLNVAGAMDLTRSYSGLQDKTKLKVLKKHLTLIGASGFGVAATYVNQQSRPSLLEAKLSSLGLAPLDSERRKDATRKTIELMIALAALNKFESVALEDPEASEISDPNPDVIVDTGKAKFGIACKSLTSRNLSNLKERIAEGIHQIDRTVAAGKLLKGHGLVLIDISALLDHDLLYMVSSNWDKTTRTDAMRWAIDKVLFDVVGASGNKKVSAKSVFGGLFAGHQAAPCVLIYGHALMIASSEWGMAPFYMKMMKNMYVGDHSKVKAFLERLNRGLHCQ